MCRTVNLNLGETVVVNYRIRHAFSLLAALFIGFTHETLDGINGVLRISDGLTLGRIAHLALAVLYKANHRRCGALAFRVSNYYWFVALKHGNTAVCCT